MCTTTNLATFCYTLAFGELHYPRCANGEYDPGWPDVRRFVVAAPSRGERIRVVRYLRAGAGWRAYRGFSLCRVCGCQNGSSELADGVWVWPEGLAHYVRRHGVRLPDVIIRYVLDHRRPSKTCSCAR